MSNNQGVVIPIDKPRQWTSFQVVNRLKWHIKRTYGLKKFKIGHAGTLDPLASGLLLVCVGKATKRIEELQSGIKTYSGTMVLGATTPCYDLEQPIDRYYPYSQITPEIIDNVSKQFVGVINQIPPLFSAVKIDGQRAYVSARDGIVADISPKQVTVYGFEITAFRPGDISKSETQQESDTRQNVINERELYRNPQGFVPEWLPQIDFIITCGKGTYIRSIARDLGIALGSGAFLGSLRRERIGDYTVDNAIKIDNIESVITPETMPIAF